MKVSRPKSSLKPMWRIQFNSLVVFASSFPKVEDVRTFTIKSIFATFIKLYHYKIVSWFAIVRGFPK